MRGDHFHARYRRTERDASQGWEAEYRHQGCPIPDGGRAEGDYETPDPLTIVTDRDGDDALAVVVECHADKPAERYWIEDIGATVADVNEAYDPTAPVVEVAFVDDVEDAGIDLDDEVTPAGLQEAVAFARVSTYHYPAPRLREVTDDDE